jgi:hypothetical protein
MSTSAAHWTKRQSISLARGAGTLLTSQWKTGKTTLVSVLLARMARGGQLAGLEVARSRAAIVSEGRRENWRRRHDLLQFGDDLVFLCRPFEARSTLQTWRALVDHLARLGKQEAIDLVVIDPLAQFLPGAAENSSCAILDALQPFEQLTAAGQSVLLLHHPRKGENAPGQAARGSGALCSSVDILLEMKLPPACQPQDRRRKLLAWSRYDETPRERVIELSHDGTDYLESRFELQEPLPGVSQGRPTPACQSAARADAPATAGPLARRPCRAPSHHALESPHPRPPSRPPSPTRLRPQNRPFPLLFAEV